MAASRNGRPLEPLPDFERARVHGRVALGCARAAGPASGALRDSPERCAGSWRSLTITADFVVRSCFTVPGIAGVHPARGTVTKRHRQLHFFLHECRLEARVPPVRLMDGGIARSSANGPADWPGFTQPFDALIVGGVVGERESF